MSERERCLREIYTNTAVFTPFATFLQTLRINQCNATTWRLPHLWHQISNQHPAAHELINLRNLWIKKFLQGRYTQT